MEQVRRWMVVVATFALIGLTAIIQFRFGAWHQQGGNIAVTGFSLASELGPMLLAAHGLKILLLPIAVDLNRRQYRLAAGLAVGLYLVLATISVGSMLGALSVQRHERVAADTAAMQRDRDLRAELALLQDRLKDIGWRREVAEVEAEIAAQQRDSRWAITGDCTGPSTRSQRNYCAHIDRLKGELAAAKEADKARRRERAILEELRGVPPTAGVRHPDLELLAGVFDVAAEQISIWRTLLIAVTIEAAEALPLWIATLLAHRGGHPVYTPTRSSWMRRMRAWVAGASASVASAADDPGSVPPRQSGTAAGDPGRLRAASSPPKSASAARPDGGGAREEVSAAVTAFVGLLLLDAEGRETGRALRSAYERVRARHGWPPIPANVFGALLKSAIEKVGGRKVKSSCQLYTGVTLPPAL